jgi:predicted AAA+ superfamily ATPase
VRGGYPEVVATQSPYRSAEYLKNYLNLTIYKDIVRTFKIRDPIAFEELVAVLARECSQRLNYSALAHTLGLKRQTLKAYLYYLKTAFLISESEYFSRSRMKRIRREKKVYINDPGIRNAAISSVSDYVLKDNFEIGKIVETVVADHCRRLKASLEPTSELQLSYWKSQGYETDIVIELLQKPIPIEVKFRESIGEKDLRGLSSFVREHNSPLSLVITQERFELVEKTIYIPLWLFLIMC